MDTHKNPEERAKEKAAKSLEPGTSATTTPTELCPECGMVLANPGKKDHKYHIPLINLNGMFKA